MADADPRRPAVVNVHEAKTHFSKLLERAHAGEEIVLAKAGKPYAKLGPIEPSPPPKKRVAGRLQGVIPPIPHSVWFDPMPEEELRLYDGE